MLREIITKCWTTHDRACETTRSNFDALLGKKCVVACSGGADSVALALLAYCNDLEFSLAYVEHELTPATSQCAVFVKQLADDLDVEFYSDHLHMESRGLGESNVESTARALRYAALEKIASSTKAEIIVTAHHADDVAETFLINLLRGAGSGAASLAEVRGGIYRPLLHWRKSDLEEFVVASGFEFFTDPSNTDPKFVRNRVRNELVPLMNDIAQRDVVPLIVRTAEITRDDQRYLDDVAQAAWSDKNPDTKKLSQLPFVVQRHAIRAWLDGMPPSLEEMQRILQVVHHEIARTQISDHRTIWRRGARLYQDVTPRSSQEKE